MAISHAGSRRAIRKHTASSAHPGGGTAILSVPFGTHPRIAPTFKLTHYPA